MLRSAYAVVMNDEQNPLRSIPKLVRFQLLTLLSLMWSVVFASWIGALQIVGPSWAAHAILLIGIFFTHDIFSRVGEGARPSYDRNFKDPADGCARYDDVWGG